MNTPIFAINYSQEYTLTMTLNNFFLHNNKKKHNHNFHNPGNSYTIFIVAIYLFTYFNFKNVTFII